MWTAIKLLFNKASVAAIAATIVTALISGIIGYGAHSYFQAKAEREKTAAVEAQKTADVKQCNADKLITHEVANDYETAISALNRQLDALRLRVEPAACAPVSAGSAAEHDGDTAGNVLRGPDDRRPGFNPAWLIQYAGDAEKTRLQLISCQSFIKKTWANQ